MSTVIYSNRIALEVYLCKYWIVLYITTAKRGLIYEITKN